MGDGKKSFVLYHDIRGPLELLDDAERGRLFLALLDYSERGTVPEFSGALGMAFAFIRTSLDRDAEAWEEKRAVRAEAGRRGGLARSRQNQAKQILPDDWKQNQTNQAVPVSGNVPGNVPENVSGKKNGGEADKPPAHTRRFVPPSLEEVAAYVRERGSRVDPQGFLDFYQAKGWLVGKTPMKDWKAACRNAESWERWQKGDGQNVVHNSTGNPGKTWNLPGVIVL